MIAPMVHTTPTKRKREELKERQLQHINYGVNKENHFAAYNNFMEVKSIADLVDIKSKQHDNPFEVTRKPPKKKDRRSLSAENCFVNPALDLNMPEKIINPFEVKRAAHMPEVVHSYENSGLNLRDNGRLPANPASCHQTINLSKKGIENPGLDVAVPLAIGVPFTPSIHRRIDFNNMNIDCMTPSTLLENKLVFSPIQKPDDAIPKRPNLSVIKEEVVDISKELDGYQLELENSVNEAKATKKSSLMDSNLRKTFPQLLSSTNNTELTPNAKSFSDDTRKPMVELPKISDEHSCHESSANHSECPKSSTPKTPNENCIAKYTMDESNEVPDVVYEEVSDSQNGLDTDAADGQSADISREIEFAAPTPFVRAYRRDVARRPSHNIASKNSVAKTSEDIKIDHKTTRDSNDVLVGFRRSIRKSIRNWVQPKANTDKKEKIENRIGSNNGASQLLSTIRHSLRRKQPKQPLATSTPCASLNDISIIVDMAKPRTVFKDVTVVAMNAISKDLPRYKLRRSVMKVFNKNVEDFNLDM